MCVLRCRNLQHKPSYRPTPYITYTQHPWLIPIRPINNNTDPYWLLFMSPPPGQHLIRCYLIPCLLLTFFGWFQKQPCPEYEAMAILYFNQQQVQFFAHICRCHFLLFSHSSFSNLMCSCSCFVFQHCTMLCFKILYHAMLQDICLKYWRHRRRSSVEQPFLILG